jgi:hypothetical protein
MRKLSVCSGVLTFIMASMSSGLFKDDCRPLKIKFHACLSEAHDQCQIDMLAYPFPDEEAKDAVDMSVDGVGIKTLNELVTACVLSDQSRIDMLKNPVSYEEAKDAVNISVDDVGAKKQKETREQNPHGPPSKK